MMGSAGARPGGRTLLRVEGLTKQAGDRTLFQDLSFSLDEGEVLCITGASGSGKSTLLRCLNGLIKADEGRIVLDGTDITGIDPPRLRRTVCLVGQQAVIFPGTVRDNLAHPFTFAINRDLPLPEWERMLMMVGLDPADLEKDAGVLSGGERQRLAIARALAISPTVLLLDEPTSALDEGSKRRVEETIRRLNREAGTTILIVTHDTAQAERLCRRRLHLEAGHGEVRNG
ncbi:ABC transporter ATP-binding protein [Methanofollis fontis]|uniref:Choline transporter n=1 Tax=Methanofollis fontis TaxID=2052832 RepID=A0A483CV69_9EURY|nr:ATP-binding cassette domain-containing protein [Methanofollis fontis]TAJ43228.1 choline transporter [Methanofollis fontis]